NIPIKGIQWQCQLNLESEWQTMKETAPDQYFLTKKKFPFPKDEITVIYDQHNEAYPLITQAIKISKKKLKSDLKRLWEPGEIGGNYYVGINEGAGFCESDNIGMVGTSGLLGCCALMVKG